MLPDPDVRKGIWIWATACRLLVFVFNVFSAAPVAARVPCGLACARVPVWRVQVERCAWHVALCLSPKTPRSPSPMCHTWVRAHACGAPAPGDARTAYSTVLGHTRQQATPAD